MREPMFWIITIIVCALVAVCLTQVIMRPIKRKREDRRWNQRKQEYATGLR